MGTKSTYSPHPLINCPINYPAPQLIFRLPIKQMLLTCRDAVGRMLIGFDFFQASQVVSWQNVGRMLSGQYVERMLIQLEKAHKPTLQQAHPKATSTSKKRLHPKTLKHEGAQNISASAKPTFSITRAWKGHLSGMAIKSEEEVICKCNKTMYCNNY